MRFLLLAILLATLASACVPFMDPPNYAPENNTNISRMGGSGE